MTVASMLAEKGRDVVTTAATISVAEAIATLAEKKIGALVVTDGGDGIIGIVSERDIVRVIAQKGSDALADPIATIMTRDVITCRESETINRVMTRMTRGRFRHLPVVEDGHLVGIVSIGDVVKARISEIEHEAEEMRAYIATA